MKWIKHDTDANNDAKLQNVLLDYGLEGYGLYWYCIELIAGKVDKENITFELEHDARIIARNTGSTPQKVEEMMRYFVEIGLFESSDGVISCLKLARRLDKSMTSNPQMREIISNLKSHDPIMTPSEKPMQDQIRLDKKKEILSPVDDEAVIQEWNKLPYLKHRLITQSAKKAIKKTWAEYQKSCKKNKREPMPQTEWIVAYLKNGFAKHYSSDHYRADADGKTGWSADLEFAMRYSTYEKVVAAI